MEKALDAANKEADNNKTEENFDTGKINSTAIFNNILLLNNVTQIKGQQHTYSLPKRIASNQTDEIPVDENETLQPIRLDPISYLAKAAGYDDGESSHAFS